MIILVNDYKDVYEAIQILATYAPRSAELSKNGKTYRIKYSSTFTKTCTIVETNSETYACGLLDRFPVFVSVSREYEGETYTFSFNQHFMQRSDFSRVHFRMDDRYAYKLGKTQFCGISPFKLACMVADDAEWAGYLRHDFAEAGYIR